MCINIKIKKKEFLKWKLKANIFTLRQAYETAINYSMLNTCVSSSSKLAIIDDFIGHLNNETKENAMLEFVTECGYEYACMVGNVKYFINKFMVIDTIKEAYKSIELA